MKVSNWFRVLIVGFLLLCMADRRLDAAWTVGPCNGSPPVCGCNGTGDCVISTAQVVTAGTVVAVGNRKIQVKSNNGRIEVANGFVTIRAGDLVVDNGQRIVAKRTTPGVPFGVIVDLTGTLDVKGAIEASSNLGGGFVKVTTAGDLLLPSAGTSGVGVEANGLTANQPGGEIVLESGRSLLIGDRLLATALEASGTSVAPGGRISATAAGVITVGAKINVFGRQADAGSISLVSLGTVTSTGQPLGFTNDADCSSADQTSKIIVQPGFGIFADGGNANGNGGSISLTAREITIDSQLSAQGGLNVGGGLSEGGNVSLEAGDCGLTINNDINVRGGEGGASLKAGPIVASSDGNLTVGAGVKLLTRSEANGGDGGDLDLEARGTLLISNAAVLDASGHSAGSNQGGAGGIDVSACNLVVEGTASIKASGFYGGSIDLTGNDNLSISGTATLTATGTPSGEAGEIVLRHKPGWCSSSPGSTCTVGTCALHPAPGRCSNIFARSCATSSECTVGTQTGECLLGTCTNSALKGCNLDAPCQNLGCSSGACNLRYAIAAGVQINPVALHEEDPNLESCP